MKLNGFGKRHGLSSLAQGAQEGHSRFQDAIVDIVEKSCLRNLLWENDPLRLLRSELL